MRYPATIKWDEADQAYLVDFPDCPGCHTYGDSLADAMAMASDALSGWIAVTYETGRSVPEPSSLQGADVYGIDVEPHVAIPIMIRRLRESAGLSQVEVAKRLGITHQTYQRWERPDANITIRNLQKVAKALGQTVHIELLPA